MMQRLCAIFARVTLLMCTLEACADVPDIAARVAAARGDCCKGPDTTTLEIATKGDSLAAGTFLKTGERSFMEVAFLDQSMYRLKSHTEAWLECLGEEVEKQLGKIVRVIKLDLISGETGVKLRNLPKDCMVQVSTPAAIAGASGTGFRVKLSSLKKTTLVQVFDNIVTVTSRDNPNKKVRLLPMQQTECFPWNDGDLTAIGYAIITEKIAEPNFIASRRMEPENIKIIATGRAELRHDIEDADQRRKAALDQAADDARSKLVGLVTLLHIDEQNSLIDLLKDDIELSYNVYELISAAKVVEQEEVDREIRVSVEIGLVELSQAIGKQVSAIYTTVREISREDYLTIVGDDRYLKIRQAAEADGRRRLTQKLYCSVIDASADFQNLGDLDMGFNKKAAEALRDARIVAERYFSDGSIALKISVPGFIIPRIFGPLVGENFLSSPLPFTFTAMEEYRELKSDEPLDAAFYQAVLEDYKKSPPSPRYAGGGGFADLPFQPGLTTSAVDYGYSDFYDWVMYGDHVLWRHMGVRSRDWQNNYWSSLQYRHRQQEFESIYDSADSYTIFDGEDGEEPPLIPEPGGLRLAAIMALLLIRKQARFN